jgi:Tfp pilus assembly protein PilZ
MDCKRTNKRVALRTTIKYGLEKPPTHTSFVTDLSVTGVCIKANRVFKPGSKLFLTLFIADKSFDAEGVVTWSQKVPQSIVRAVKSGMGIEFTSVEQELLDICKERNE